MAGIPVVKKATLTSSLLGGYIAVHDCPHCHNELKSKEAEIGSPDECPECGGAFMLSQTYRDQIELDKQQKRDEKAQKAAAKQRAKIAREAAKASEREAREKIEQQQRTQEQIAVSAANSVTNKGKTNRDLARCMDCDGVVSKRAYLCPHCAAPFEENNNARILGFFGILIFVFFTFIYDTTNGGVHNIGLLNNRLCGLIVGLAFCTWAIIYSKK